MPAMIRGSKKLRAIAAKVLKEPSIKKMTPLYRPDITLTKTYESLRKLM